MRRAGIRTLPRSILIIVLTVWMGQFLCARKVYSAGRVEDLRLFRCGGWLRAEIRALDLLDPRTTSTIESGFPGTCVYRVVLEDRTGRAVAQRYVAQSLRVDFWENRYRLEGPDGTRTFPGLAPADSALSHLASCAVCPVTQLRSGEEYRLVVLIAVRPLAPADREHLSRYVTRNRGLDNEDVTLDLEAIFARVFGAPEEDGGVIRHAGPFLRVADLPEEP
jgi:hypothetical protein